MLRRISLLLLLGPLVAACSPADEPGKPVPIGDKAALQRLADEYTKLSRDMPLSPMRLRPEKRKDFVVKVFSASGYSYKSTLDEMAAGGWDVTDQNARDLVGLLFMPHANIDPSQGLEGVYSDQELADVRKIEKMLP
jgi:hypothetical protein